MNGNDILITDFFTRISRMTDEALKIMKSSLTQQPEETDSVNVMLGNGAVTDLIVRVSLSDADFFAKTSQITEEALNIMTSKRSDYGHLNLDILGFDGLIPYLVSKVLRVYNLSSRSKVANNESIRDSLIDIINYAIMAIIYKDIENHDGV
jgi:hypothetical protein